MPGAIVIKGNAVSEEESKAIHDKIMLVHLKRIKRSLVNKDGVTGIELQYRDALDSLQIHSERMLATMTMQCFGEAFEEVAEVVKTLPVEYQVKFVTVLGSFSVMNQEAFALAEHHSETLREMGLE